MQEYQKFKVILGYLGSWLEAYFGYRTPASKPKPIAPCYKPTVQLNNNRNCHVDVVFLAGNSDRAHQLEESTFLLLDTGCVFFQTSRLPWSTFDCDNKGSDPCCSPHSFLQCAIKWLRDTSHLVPRFKAGGAATTGNV